MLKGEQWLWAIFTIIMAVTAYPLTIGAIVSGAVCYAAFFKLKAPERFITPTFWIITLLVAFLVVSNFGYVSSGLGYDGSESCSNKYDC